MKRILSIILCAIMVMAIIPASIFMTSAALTNTLYENSFTGTNVLRKGTFEGTYAEGDGLVYTIGKGASWSSGELALNGDGLVTIVDIFGGYRAAVSIKINGTTVITQVHNAQSITIGNASSGGTTKTATVGDLKANQATITVDPATGKVNISVLVQGSTTPVEATAYIGESVESITLEHVNASTSSNYQGAIDYLKIVQASADAAIDFGVVGYQKTDVVLSDSAETVYYKDYTGTEVSDEGTDLTPDDTEDESWAKIDGVEVSEEGGTWSSAEITPAQTSGVFSITWKTFYRNATSGTDGKTSYLINGTEVFHIVPGGTQIVVGDDTYSVSIASKQALTIKLTLDFATGDGTLALSGTKSNINIHTGSEDTEDLVEYDTVPFSLGGAVTSLKFGAENTTVSGKAYILMDSIEVVRTPDESENFGLYSVRFIGVGTETAGIGEVGFVVTINGRSIELQTTQVYEQITANYGTEAVTAEQHGGTYITAVAITGIPTSQGNLDCEVTPFVTVGGVAVYGETKTVTIEPTYAS